MIFDTFTVSYIHQHHFVGQNFSGPISNPSPMHYSSFLYSKPYLMFSLSISKLKYTLFPLFKNNYPCCKDLTFTEFSSLLCHDSNINTSKLTFYEPINWFLLTDWHTHDSTMNCSPTLFSAYNHFYQKKVLFLCPLTYT